MWKTHYSVYVTPADGIQPACNMEILKRIERVDTLLKQDILYCVRLQLESLVLPV